MSAAMHSVTDGPCRHSGDMLIDAMIYCVAIYDWLKDVEVKIFIKSIRNIKNVSNVCKR